MLFHVLLIPIVHASDSTQRLLSLA